MNFAENFKSARSKSGLTQLQLAEALGLDRTAIAQYERGICKPNIENLPKICELLNVKYEELLK